MSKDKRTTPATAEILSIGTELLLGNTLNTNATYIAKELASLGIYSYWQTVVGDNPLRLERAITLALSRADILIMTGGLGPTYDDVTKEVVAEHFSLPLSLHETSYILLEEKFRRMNRPMTDNNKKQAMMPKGATIFYNDNGTADGLAVEQDGKSVIMLPGPPNEMTAMFQKSVRPYLMEFTGQVLHSHTIHLFGIGESSLEQELHDFMLEQTNPTIAPYASAGEVSLEVTAKAETKEEAEVLLAPVLAKIQKEFPAYVYGIDVGNLETALVQALTEKKVTIATAESCTGGLISQRLTSVSGASEVFGYGLCTYANQAKENLLGVRKETLAQYGAVSEQTAQEMAEGVCRISGADIGISVTGIAGPTGGTKEKPVGLVYVGVSSPFGTQVLELQLARGYSNDRERIRFSAASHALHLALETVKKF